MVLFFSPSNSSLVAKPKSPALICIFSSRKRLPSFRLNKHLAFIQDNKLLSMDDSICVEVLEGRNYLSQVALNLEFCQSLSSLQQLIQSLVRTDLQKNVNVLLVLKNVLKANNICMMKRLVDLDFGNKLEFLAL